MARRALAVLGVVCICSAVQEPMKAARPGSLPSPWQNQDIGAVGRKGSSSYSNGVFTVTGSGANIWGTADGFQYAYQAHTGDGEIVARVTGITNTNTYAKAGVMLRETLTEGSADVILDVRPNFTIEFMTRPATGAATSFIAAATQSVPGWLKLVRSGSVVAGYTSADGNNWILVGTTSVAMASNAYLGMAVTSVDNTLLNKSTFDHVAVRAVSTPLPPGAPSSPAPANGSTNVTINPTLTWSASGATTYDVRFGTTATPPTVSAGQTSASYTPTVLAYATTYYWQIVAYNSGGSTPGPVWAFTTAAAPLPPGTPASPAPADGATGVSAAVTLTWTAAGATAYDVAFGTTTPPPPVATSLSGAAYAVSGLLANTTYFWQITARNAYGTTVGPVWSFTTGASTGTVWFVPAGGDLQSAINNAQPGDTILLEAGATFVGNYTLPSKDSATVYVTIRTSADDSALPPANTRIDPSYSPQLAKLQSPNSMPALATAPGAHHYQVELLEFLANYQGYGDILTLGDGSSAQNSLSLVPHDLIVDRVYMHGDPTYGQKRGIALNSASTTIENSYIANIMAVGQDSQAVGGWNGPGPFTITNNYLEAAGENLMFGGADPSIQNLVPSNITVTRNHLAKQPAWRTAQWQVKNLFELKNAQQVIVDGNVMEYNWLAAQDGWAIQLTPRNQDGTAPWSVVQQVQITNNVVQHVSGGVNILGTDNNYPSLELNNVIVRNNFFADVSGATYGGHGWLVAIGGGNSVTIDHNTALIDGSSALYAYGTQAQSFVFTNNIAPDNSYAIMGDNASPGNGTIAMYFPGSTFLDGIYAGSNPAVYPPNNYYPATMADVGFVNYVPLFGGNYRLSTASPYRNLASDGSDIGVNFDQLNAATGLQY